MLIQNNKAISGGGVRTVASSLYMNDSIVQLNTASLVSAGIQLSDFNSSKSSVIAGNSSINNNHSRYSGGGRVDDHGLTIFSPTVIEQNTADEHTGGFGVLYSNLNIYGKQICEGDYCFGSDSEPVRIVNNKTDLNNNGEGNGGGMWSYYSTIDIRNALFKGNKAIKGAAIHTYGISEDTITVSASHFEQNHADLGAILSVIGNDNNGMKKVTIQDSTIIDNGTGGDYDGASLFYNINRSVLNLIHNTIADNHVLEKLIINSGMDVKTYLSSNIVDEDNELYIGNNDATLDIKCMLVKNASNLPIQEDITVGDAMFVDSNAGDYRLNAESPAIDYCNKAVESNTDKDGVPRGYDVLYIENKFGPYDLGAYVFEFIDIIFEDGFDL